MNKFKSSCCYCFDLKTGCFILGYLGLVGVFLYIFRAALAIYYIVIPVDEANGYSIRYINPTVIVIPAVLFFLCALALIFYIVLLVGLHKDKPGHIKAYLIYNTIFIIIYGIITAVNIFVGHAGVLTIMIRTVEILLSAFCLVVIRSYYGSMKEGPPYEKA